VAAPQGVVRLRGTKINCRKTHFINLQKVRADEVKVEDVFKTIVVFAEPTFLTSVDSTTPAPLPEKYRASDAALRRAGALPGSAGAAAAAAAGEGAGGLPAAAAVRSCELCCHINALSHGMRNARAAQVKVGDAVASQEDEKQQEEEKPAPGE
jgi:hypothetical protein